MRVTYTERKREDKSQRRHGQYVYKDTADRVRHLRDNGLLELGTEIPEQRAAGACRELDDVAVRVIREYRADLVDHKVLEDGSGDAKSREDAGNLGYSSVVPAG